MVNLVLDAPKLWIQPCLRFIFSW